MTPPSAFVFDFGNVVAHFDYRKAGERLGRPLGLSGREFIDRATALGLPTLLQRYESGDLTTLEFFEFFKALTGIIADFDEFSAGWVGIFSANESVHEVVHALKARGFKLVLGSNTNELHAGHFRRQFAELLDGFDALVLSHEVRVLKPGAPFYLACAEAAGCPPGDCLFVDDLAENVEGARAAGLRAVQYRDTATLLSDLASMGVDLGSDGPRARQTEPS